MNLSGKKINFLGDSITHGSGTSGEDKRFSNLIAAKTGAICRNYGIGGTRIARQFNRTIPDFDDNDYCSRVCKMDPDADIVVVFGGTNDFGHGDAPLGTPTDRTDGTFYGAMHVLCNRLIERYPSAAVVFITPLHRCNEASLRGDNKPMDIGNLKTYVDIIREVTEYYSLPVLDLYATSGLQPLVPVIKEKFVPDGLHPNDAGHVILADKIIAFLENTL